MISRKCKGVFAKTPRRRGCGRSGRPRGVLGLDGPRCTGAGAWSAGPWWTGPVRGGGGRPGRDGAMAGLAASSLRSAAGRCGAREVTPRAWEGRAGRGEADEHVIKDREWPGRWVRVAAAVELRRGRKHERKGEREGGRRSSGFLTLQRTSRRSPSRPGRSEREERRRVELQGAAMAARARKLGHGRRRLLLGLGRDAAHRAKPFYGRGHPRGARSGSNQRRQRRPRCAARGGRDG